MVTKDSTTDIDGTKQPITYSTPPLRNSTQDSSDSIKFNITNSSNNELTLPSLHREDKQTTTPGTSGSLSPHSIASMLDSITPPKLPTGQVDPAEIAEKTSKRDLGQPSNNPKAQIVVTVESKYLSPEMEKALNKIGKAILLVRLHKGPRQTKKGRSKGDEEN